MCGRYTLTTPAEVVAQVFRLGVVTGYQPRYNVAPTQMAPVIRVSHTTGERKLELMRWGLIPFWTKGSEDEALRGAAKMINVRSETVASKPAYRNLPERRRCLVPADAFYEWQNVTVARASRPGESSPQSPRHGRSGPWPGRDARATNRQPFAIRLKDDRVFAFAGLWDRWRNEKGEALDTYTILTTQPNEVAGRYHDRMPVMLISPEQWDRWLDESITDVDALRPLMSPPVDETMRAYPVSPRVNSAVRSDGQINDDAGMLAEAPEIKPPTQTEQSLFD